jgi:hypothetical protein
MNCERLWHIWSILRPVAAIIRNHLVADSPLPPDSLDKILPFNGLRTGFSCKIVQ